MNLDTLFGDVRLKWVDDLLDVLIRVLAYFKLLLELIFPDFHSLDLVCVVEPHCLAWLLNSLEDLQSLLPLDMLLLFSIFILGKLKVFFEEVLCF
jgi:hypothetical protein